MRPYNIDEIDYRIPAAKKRPNLREKLLRTQASTLTRDMLVTMTTNGDTMIDEHIMQNLSQFRYQFHQHFKSGFCANFLSKKLIYYYHWNFCYTFSH